MRLVEPGPAPRVPDQLFAALGDPTDKDVRRRRMLVEQAQTSSVNQQGKLFKSLDLEDISTTEIGRRRLAAEDGLRHEMADALTQGRGGCRRPRRRNPARAETQASRAREVPRSRPANGRVGARHHDGRKQGAARHRRGATRDRPARRDASRRHARPRARDEGRFVGDRRWARVACGLAGVLAQRRHPTLHRSQGPQRRQRQPHRGGARPDRRRDPSQAPVRLA